jgi:hypothetical protein
MSDLIFYIASIASALGPITLTAASAAALSIIGPNGAFRSAERALNMLTTNSNQSTNWKRRNPWRSLSIDIRRLDQCFENCKED